MPETTQSSIAFSGFVISLVTTAAVHFGDYPDPVTGETKPPNLLGAAQMIDILTMLEEKTRGNLTAQERSLLEQSSYELRMRFVARQEAGGRDHAGAVVMPGIGRVTFLGSGTSHGVPMIGCACDDVPVRTTRATSGRGRPSTSNWRTARASSSTRRRTCAARRSRSASSASMPSCSRTATPTTSWGSTMCGGSTCCRTPPFRVSAIAQTVDGLRRTFSLHLRVHRTRRRAAAHRAAPRRAARSAFGGRRSCRCRCVHGTPHDLRVPPGRLRVPDRLQRHPRRVVGRC